MFKNLNEAQWNNLTKWLRIGLVSLGIMALVFISYLIANIGRDRCINDAIILGDPFNTAAPLARVMAVEGAISENDSLLAAWWGMDGDMNLLLGMRLLQAGFYTAEIKCFGRDVNGNIIPIYSDIRLEEVN